MTQLFVLLALVFTLVSAFMMIRPFIGSRQDQLSFELLDEELRSIEALVSRKVALVQALRDIEYDYDTDKISEDDYRRFKTSCERQAIGVMRRLDKIHGADKDWDAVIDQAVAERLGATDADLDTPQEPAESHEIGADEPPSSSTPESASPASTEPQSQITCRDCDTPLEPDDRFCSQCGTPTADDALDLHPSDSHEVAG